VGDIRGSGGPARVHGRDRILTVPNGISVARLLGVPAFLWLVLGPRDDVPAVALLVAAGLSDWLDGKIARALNQQSRLGEVLDPAADRLYIAATLVGLAVREIIPWWLVALLLAREGTVAAALAVLRRRLGISALRVSFTGKAATLCLLYAFPLLFLGAHEGTWAMAMRIVGWAFAIWGTGLYWWSAVLYLAQARALLTGRLALTPGQAHGPGARDGPPGPAGSAGSALPDMRSGAETPQEPGIEDVGQHGKEQRKH